MPSSPTHQVPQPSAPQPSAPQPSAPVEFAGAARSIPPNVFAVTDRKVEESIAAGNDVIDLAKGNPDAYPEEFIRDAARQAIDDPANARYTPFDGKPAYLRAAADWYRRMHGVTLDWHTQLFAVEGAVDALAGLYSIILDPGDAVAFADPYYPSYHCMARMRRAEEILLPATRDHGFLPDLDAVGGEVWDRVKMLVLNYPNNPTGAQAPLEFLARSVELARRHRFVIVHDYAYCGLGVGTAGAGMAGVVDDGHGAAVGRAGQQHSILEVPGACDVAVEVCSLSKMYAMAGWRAGFVAGNAPVVDHLKRYHYQMGSMITGNVQDAGVVALQSDQSCVARLAQRYAERRRIVAQGLRSAGLDVFDSAGGIYVWALVPQAWRGDDGSGTTGGERFADVMLDRARVAMLPGSCFGSVGGDYVRLSLLKPRNMLEEAVRRICAAVAQTDDVGCAVRDLPCADAVR
ncbi:aminotransferase class I/II-fold pyridoxal phosphate-dependent enzyme [Bifidobacterium jacchi]|uniref:Aminotransferase n=2 Tax=Bifidobacterium jacchi TaxID=2490545 RepID=A0A5N5RHZ6_9BIFI|nr:aminotransferase class I/II-fold pyridoxal phosphate-dependent enzyme [Bifidobacterium jacchi]